ncbi:MAG: hypothetical protein ACRDSP_21605 [Pseudonocardiaceae bacterium]
MSQPYDPQPQEAPQPAPGTHTGPIPAPPKYASEPPRLTRSVDPPGVVRWSFWLWLGSFAVGLLAIAYSVSKVDTIRGLLENDVRAQRPGISIELLNRVVDTTLYVGLAATTAVILMQLLLAVLMRTRRNWARITLVLMGAFGLVVTVFSLVTVDEKARAALPLQALLMVIATVLMFLPSAGAWFRHRSA